MQIITSPSDYQQLGLKWRAAGESHAQVPTMGALHEGHFALIDEARRRAERVSVTLFVNPIQFNSAADFEKYPNTFEADAEACRVRGVDVLFAPTREAMYPLGFDTHVEVGAMASPLCGEHRPGHFRGVTTVVMKLFMLGQPTAAIFGWKDAQQFIILRKMAADLALPIEMIGIDTIREADGLAKSSRNVRLSQEYRRAVPAIYQGLRAAAEHFAQGERNTAKLLGAARAPVEDQPILKIEYLEARALDTLAEQHTTEPGNTLIAAAVWAGDVRLIDNVRLK
jgi:pantoate--beta-alanine ligase